MFNEVFWVGVSFITLLVLLYKPISRAMVQALDKRAAQIAKELDEAVRLREEAQATLALYQQKHVEIANEADAILSHAKQEAERLRNEAQVRLEQAIAVRTVRAEDKIAQEESRAVAHVQQQLVELAVNAAQHLLTDTMQSDADEFLTASAVKKISTLVH